jgi:hypothetical protein
LETVDSFRRNLETGKSRRKEVESEGRETLGAGGRRDGKWGFLEATIGSVRGKGVAEVLNKKTKERGGVGLFFLLY